VAGSGRELVAIAGQAGDVAQDRGLGIHSVRLPVTLFASSKGRSPSLLATLRGPAPAPRSRGLLQSRLDHAEGPTAHASLTCCFSVAGAAVSDRTGLCKVLAQGGEQAALAPWAGMSLKIPEGAAPLRAAGREWRGPDPRPRPDPHQLVEIGPGAGDGDGHTLRP